MADAALIHQWARNIGLHPCVGFEYATDHNGNLPATLEQLVSWGNATNHRDANGNWRCFGVAPVLPDPGGSSGGGSGGGSVVTPSPVTPVAPGAGGDIIGQVVGWVKRYPIPAAAIAYFVFLRRR